MLDCHQDGLDWVAAFISFYYYLVFNSVLNVKRMEGVVLLLKCFYEPGKHLLAVKGGIF